MSDAVDLRQADVETALVRVSRALGVRLDRSRLVRKRRTVGAPSDRGTWVRIERRPASRENGQGWGTEAAAALSGVAMPMWRAGTSWRAEDGALWHADECDLASAPPVKHGGRLLADPGLPEAWWTVFNASMDALAGHATTRVATPDTAPVTAEPVAARVAEAFPEACAPPVREWTAAHADLNWANITGC